MAMPNSSRWTLRSSICLFAAEYSAGGMVDKKLSTTGFGIRSRRSTAEMLASFQDFLGFDRS